VNLGLDKILVYRVT